MSTTNLFAQKTDSTQYPNKEKKEVSYHKQPWKGNNAFLHDYLKSISYFGNETKIRFLVPIQFWIYRYNDGSGGASLKDIDKYMNDLNYYNRLNNTGFQFYISNIREINKTKRTTLGYYLEAPLQGIFRHKKNAINVHVIDGFKLRKGEKKLVRGSYNYISKSIMMRKITSSTSLTHEVGHYFGLLHPHRNYNKGKNKQEPVSRTLARKHKGKDVPLCELHGDYLSDTPAEPKLTFLVNNDCEFVGTSLTDDWGEKYKSNTNNIMSYPSNYYCRNNFTTGQIAVMLYMAASYKTAKNWSTDYAKNQKFAFDQTEPNDYFQMATEIKLNQNYNLNFHQILIRNNKSRADTCDWYKVEIKEADKKNIRIVVNNANNIQNLTVALYDKNEIKLNEIANSSNKNITLEYKNLVDDFYFIKISKPENSKDAGLSRYSMRITTF